jgi:hypothetical protein
MAREVRVDVSNNAELLQLAEEVSRSNTPRVLERNSEPIAVIVPVRRSRQRKQPSTADVEATLASAGGWRNLVDAEDLKRQIREGRSDHRGTVVLDR